MSTNYQTILSRCTREKDAEIDKEEATAAEKKRQFLTQRENGKINFHWYRYFNCYRNLLFVCVLRLNLMNIYSMFRWMASKQSVDSLYALHKQFPLQMHTTAYLFTLYIICCFLFTEHSHFFRIVSPERIYIPQKERHEFCTVNSTLKYGKR